MENRLIEPGGIVVRIRTSQIAACSGIDLRGLGLRRLNLARIFASMPPWRAA